MDELRRSNEILAAMDIRRPVPIIDRARVEANLADFAAKARSAGVRLRPHAKTHQSAEIAAWSRAHGVTGLAVSNLEMAAYFADHGWDDLTLAFLVNPRRRDEIEALAERVDLGILVDRPEVARELVAPRSRPLRVWLKVDVGYGRTGVPWNDASALCAVAAAIDCRPGLEPAGLLTHAGQTYGAPDREAAAVVFAAARERMRAAHATLVAEGLTGGAISVGDTPGCGASADWSGVDEARPGNFVFYDLMQLRAGICDARRLAVAVACPVVGVYPREGRVVIHGGAVHLARERLTDGRGDWYGELMTITEDGLGQPLADLRVTGLSQEHGVVTAGDPARGREFAAALSPGDVVLVVPVHSCLACEQFAGYLTTDGQAVARLR